MPLMGMARTARIKKIHIVNLYNKTRFVFSVNKDFDYKHFALSHPSRFVVDFPNANAKLSFKHLALAKTPVKSLRHSHHRNTYRVVFDLRHNSTIKTIRPKQHPVGQYQLYVDVMKPMHKMVGNHPVKHSTKSKPTTVVKVASNEQFHRTSRKIIVVIDPGHGGKDPGAAGKHGTREKNVVLAIARKLQAQINAEPGFKAILTRRGDYYIGLRRRLVLAHHYKADMFVAIHADAYLHRRAHGASVYALSERGATSEAARWIAKKENESEFVGGLDLADKDYLVRSVLIDLSQTHTIGVSLQMGQEMLYELSQFATLHHPGVEQAAFVVLKSPDIPSLLVETGFLSNPTEERNLTNAHYQYKIAIAVKRGIKKYFVEHPPRGTHLANLKHSSRRHT